jgi:3-dehydroquinate synthetase
MYQVGRKLIPETIWNTFASLNIEKLLPFLESDKKVEGSVLKLATLHRIGEMIFLDLPLNNEGMVEVKHAFDDVVNYKLK